jgi:3' terminal RNA ribose 2'-O-methyltransferase Hen1
MLLTISTTGPAAADLGFLLHKRPDRLQEFALTFGRALVFYPVDDADRCTAALAVEVDPVGLVRKDARGGGDFALASYVNDRPYAASSFLSVALGTVFGTAMAGKSQGRQESADRALPFVATVACAPCRGDEDLVRRLFEPLGYVVAFEAAPLDPRFPSWGQSRYGALTLSGEVRLRDLLAHLYVLLPVLDGDKHYWVDEDEVDKLLRRGEGWLESHPEKETIASRYLKRRGYLTRMALARLSEAEEEGTDPDMETVRGDAAENVLEKPLSLNAQRIGAVLSALKAAGARRVVDLGCGEGRFLAEALREASFEKLYGIDVSARCLERAADRLKLDRLAPAARERVELLHGSLLYGDDRPQGIDAAVCIEVVEHVDPPRLPFVARRLFGPRAPATVVVTTPNREYNAKFPGMAPGTFRHRDHRFEWTRAEFAAWLAAAAPGYRCDVFPVGPVDADLGAPTQMAVCRRIGAAS